MQDQYSGIGGAYVLINGERVPAEQVKSNPSPEVPAKPEPAKPAPEPAKHSQE